MKEKIMRQYQKDFGTKFILLPNPVYGEWESALAENYSGLSPEEKNMARKGFSKVGLEIKNKNFEKCLITDDIL